MIKYIVFNTQIPDMPNMKWMNNIYINKLKVVPGWICICMELKLK